MMPVGLAFLGLELWVLRTLLIDAPAGKPLPSSISLQRVDVSSAGLYRGTTARREKWTAPASATPAAPAAESATPAAPAEPTAQS